MPVLGRGEAIAESQGAAVASNSRLVFVACSACGPRLHLYLECLDGCESESSVDSAIFEGDLIWLPLRLPPLLKL